ncbi:SIS domain-containing protein (plasmid) [Lichenicola cladoniae]|uniref:SIS domain-containing protein n=1 Tax=Lichenicola cladoniae TaxID=1484109 RepID=A0A6M8HXP8_9PROT|nr:SIS domain-containing protein [Lichenicola cladoniae]NPD67823.1 SIS domain-containing protein [Acetobacteraceae bacterium]QKE93334.1 SIS domain-containing protein [Lichenicola cladoniae]
MPSDDDRPEKVSERPAPSGRNVMELILVRLPELRKSDRRVGEHILSDPQAALVATVAETARKAGVSEPTVMRFCTALGFEGFQDFKLKLAHSVALGVPATQSVLDATDTPQKLTNKVFDYTMTSLDWARSQLDHEAVAQAIELLAKARRIEFFGFGASWIVAADAQQKFPLFGVPCTVHSDSHQQFIAASMMQPGDVAVAISNTGQTSALLDIMRTARAAGATVLGICGRDGGRMSRLCDRLLVIETLENTDIYTPTISRLAALVLVDILAVGVAMRRGSDHQQRLAAMKKRLSSMRSRGASEDD